MRQSTAVKILAEGKSVFLTGAPGAGKTHLLNRFINYLQKRNVPLAITAPTGIAATHINGMTLHSWSGMGIHNQIDMNVVENLLKKSYLKKRFETTKVLIIDEVSMLDPSLFHAVSEILKNVHFSPQAFGGIQVVLTGDFFQLPPVVRKSPKEAENFSQLSFEEQQEKDSERFIWQTETWKQLHPTICYLSERHRHNDHNLIQLLDEIRSGKTSEKSRLVLEKCKQRSLSAKNNSTKLYTHNRDVDQINTTELKKIAGKSHTYTVVMKGNKPLAEKMLHSSLVSEEIEIKKGAFVLFIKNNFEKGYVNGTLGEVVDFDEESSYPVVRTKDGRHIQATPEEWSTTSERGEKLATIKQIPLRLAWAITVHKSQGMTLDSAEIDLSKAFETGHGYVALSRVKDMQGLSILGYNEIALQVDDSVLKIDSEMKRQSHYTEAEYIQKPCTEKYPPLSDEEKKQRFTPKIPTIEKTRVLLSEGFDLNNISEKRDIKIGTVLSHIEQLGNLGVLPDSIEHIWPSKKIQNQIITAKSIIQKRKNKTDFTEKNIIKITAVFRELNGKIPYDDIRLAGLCERFCN